MNLRNRRLLYIFFFIIFFASAPPLVLYTAGFRYDFEYRRVVETGSLVVRSRPNNADIVLNGQLYHAQTPTIINDLLPGEINLKVNKDGFHPWEQNIEIHPRVTTFEDNIKLYPQTLPQIFLADKIKRYWWNSRNNKLVYLNNKDELRLFNSLNQSNFLLANLKTKPLLELSWSPNSDLILLSRAEKENSENFIIDANTPQKVIDLADVVNLNLEKISWDPASNHSLYALSKGSLYRFSFLLKTSRLILLGPISDYLIQDKRLFFIEENKNTSFISWVNITDPNTVHRLTEKTASAFDKLLPTNTHLAAIHNSLSKELFIYDLTIRKTEEYDPLTIIKNVRFAFWSQSGEKMIYSDGFAIYQKKFTAPLTIIPASNQSELIIRYSQPINAILWADDQYHVFYLFNDSLRVAEIKSSTDPRVLTLLDNIGSIAQIEYPKKLESLTYLDENSNLNILNLSSEKSGSFFFGN